MYFHELVLLILFQGFQTHGLFFTIIEREVRHTNIQTNKQTDRKTERSDMFRFVKVRLC